MSNDKARVNNSAKFLAKAQAQFDESWLAESENRASAKKSQDFVDGKQWDEKTKRYRIAKGKTTVTVNKLRKIIRRLVNDIRQNLPRQKVIPSQGDDSVGAELLDGVIMQIERDSNAEDIYHNAMEQAANGGYGYWRIVTERKNTGAFEQVVKLKKVPNRFTVYADQSAEDYNYSDGEYLFKTEVMSKKAFKRRFPGKPFPTEDMAHSDGEGKEKWFIGDQVRVAEYFYKKPVTIKTGLFHNEETDDMFERELKGDISIETFEANGYVLKKEWKDKTHKVMWAMISGSHVLEQPREFPSKYIPFVPVLGYEENNEGARIFRAATYDAEDSQQTYNYLLSKALERISLAANTLYMATKAQVKGHEKQWNNLHRENYPYVLYNPDPTAGNRPPERIDPIEPSSGFTTHMGIANSDIQDSTAANEAFFGQKSNERSKIAIDARSLAASITLFTFASNFLKSMIYSGKILLDVIPKIYDTERVIRIVGPKGNMYDVTVNRTVADINTLELVTVNDIMHGEFDYVAETGINFATQQQERRAELNNLIGIVPDAFKGILLSMFIDASDFPGKDEVLSAINQVTQQQNQLAEQQLGAAQQA